MLAETHPLATGFPHARSLWAVCSRRQEGSAAANPSSAEIRYDLSSLDLKNAPL